MNVINKFLIKLVVKRLRKRVIKLDLLAAKHFDSALDMPAGFDKACTHALGAVCLRDAIETERDADQLETFL